MEDQINWLTDKITIDNLRVVRVVSCARQSIGAEVVFRRLVDAHQRSTGVRYFTRESETIHASDGTEVANVGKRARFGSTTN